MSLEDAEEMLQKCNEMHPDDSPCAGVFQYVAELATEITEKETERCDLINNQNYIALINHANMNEIKAQIQENEKLINEFNELVDMCVAINKECNRFCEECKKMQDETKE